MTMQDDHLNHGPNCRTNEAANIPQLCNYCGSHIATTPSDGGAWICDYCITRALVGEMKFAQILAVQACLAQANGKDVALGIAVAEWRRLQSALQAPPTIQQLGVKTHAT